jgi:hypothetical protein
LKLYYGYYGYFLELFILFGEELEEIKFAKNVEVVI